MDFLTTTALSPPQSPQSPTSDFRKIHTASKKATDESLAWLRSQTNANSKTGLFKHLDLAKQAQRKGTEMPESIQQRLEEAISKRLWVLDVHASQFGADEQHANCIELLADILFTFCPEKRPPPPTTIYEADSNICRATHVLHGVLSTGASLLAATSYNVGASLLLSSGLVRAVLVDNSLWNAHPRVL